VHSFLSTHHIITIIISSNILVIVIKSLSSSSSYLPAIDVDRCTHALPHVGFPVTIILGTVRPNEDALSIHLVALEVASVEAACNGWMDG
jgi:hypothetical protein